MIMRNARTGSPPPQQRPSPLLACSPRAAAAVRRLGSRPGGYGQAAAAAQPANPVPILYRTGVNVPPGTRLGKTDGYGERYADGLLRPR